MTLITVNFLFDTIYNYILVEIEKNKYESPERNTSWNPNNLSENNSLQRVQGNNVSSFYEDFRKRS